MLWQRVGYDPSEKVGFFPQDGDLAAKKKPGATIG